MEMGHSVYLWEICGRVRLGFSYEPSANLRELEERLGERATRVFTAPVTHGILREARKLLGRKCFAAYIALTFDCAKNRLISAAEK